MKRSSSGVREKLRVGVVDIGVYLAGLTDLSKVANFRVALGREMDEFGYHHWHFSSHQRASMSP
jgi:hypothetical protein